MCMKTFMKIVTGVLSVAFLALGIVFLVVGFVLQFGMSTVVGYISTYTVQLNTYLAAANAQFDINTYINYLPAVTGNLAIVFIIMGAVTAGVAILGLVAICCEVKCALVIFSTRAKAYMQTTIDSKYTGYNNTNMETILWNVFHMSLSCCGINNGSDFFTSTSWPRAVNYSGGYWASIAYPLTCCKLTNYSACISTNHTDATYSNWNIGCYKLIDSVVQINIVYAALGTAACILLQALILDFAVHLCRKTNGKAV